MASTQVTGFSALIFKFGRGASSTTEQPVWSRGGAYPGFDLSPATISIVSDSTDDVLAGGGALTMRVEGEDQNGELVQEDFTLNGTTPVVSTKQFTAVYRAKILTTEDLDPITGPNHGTITVTHTGAGTPVIAEIAATVGQTEMAIFKTPSNMFGVWEGFDVFPFNRRETNFIIRQKTNGGAWQDKINITVDVRQEETFFPTPRYIPPNTWIAVWHDNASGNGTSTAHFKVKLKPV
jgi:hypothetical protein